MLNNIIVTFVSKLESFKTSLNQETENTTIQSFKSILLKNGDYCLVSDFTDLQNIHLCKAVHSKLVPDVYETHNFDIVLKTMTSEGWLLEFMM